MSVLSRFTKFTTQKEPVLSAGVLAAIALYVITRFVPGLTDDDLQLLGLLLVPIIPALLARLKAWAPASAASAIEHARQIGFDDGWQQRARQKPGDVVRQIDPDTRTKER